MCDLLIFHMVLTGKAFIASTSSDTGITGNTGDTGNTGVTNHTGITELKGNTGTACKRVLQV